MATSFVKNRSNLNTYNVQGAEYRRNRPAKKDSSMLRAEAKDDAISAVKAYANLARAAVDSDLSAVDFDKDGKSQVRRIGSKAVSSLSKALAANDRDRKAGKLPARPPVEVPKDAPIGPVQENGAFDSVQAA